MKGRLKRIAGAALCFLPAAIHAKWTGPALWAHSSSSAFDAMVGLWMLAVALAFYGLILIWSEFNR